MSAKFSLVWRLRISSLCLKAPRVLKDGLHFGFASVLCATEMCLLSTAASCREEQKDETVIYMVHHNGRKPLTANLIFSVVRYGRAACQLWYRATQLSSFILELYILIHVCLCIHSPLPCVDGLLMRQWVWLHSQDSLQSAAWMSKSLWKLYLDPHKKKKKEKKSSSSTYSFISSSFHHGWSADTRCDYQVLEKLFLTISIIGPLTLIAILAKSFQP